MRKPPIDPMVWHPPAAPPRARQRQGPAPAHLRVLALPGRGPEDVAVDSDGTVVSGIADGRILRVSPDGHVDVVAHTGGRPLGIELAGDGELTVCDAQRG